MIINIRIIITCRRHSMLPRHAAPYRSMANRTGRTDRRTDACDAKRENIIRDDVAYRVVVHKIY